MRRMLSVVCASLLLGTGALAAQAPVAGDVSAPGVPGARGPRVALGYAANFPRQPFGGAMLLLRDGLGLYADARTTVPDPGFSKDVPVVTADTIVAAPGHSKDFKHVYLSWSAGLTWSRSRWGAYAAAGPVRRRVYLKVIDDAGLFSQTGSIWGEDKSRRRQVLAVQAGVVRELSPSTLLLLGGQSYPLGGTFGFALALNGRPD